MQRLCVRRFNSAQKSGVTKNTYCKHFIHSLLNKYQRWLQPQKNKTRPASVLCAFPVVNNTFGTYKIRSHNESDCVSFSFSFANLSINPLPAKLFNLNFHPLQVVTRWRDPQLQVSENYSDLTKWKSTVFKYCWLMSPFIFNMFKRWYLMC